MEYKSVGVYGSDVQFVVSGSEMSRERKRRRVLTRGERFVADSRVGLQTGAIRDLGRQGRCYLWTLYCNEGEMERRNNKREDRRDANCTGECAINTVLEVGRGIDNGELCGDLRVNIWVQRAPLRTDRVGRGVFWEEREESKCHLRDPVHDE